MATERSPIRGDERLLWDCTAIGRMIDDDRPPARERLTSELGPELTAILLYPATQETVPDEQTA